jgi:predicted dehydrogenase
VTDAAEHPVRVALLGYGLAGRVFHAPLVTATPGMRVDAVVTGDPQRAAQVAADLPRARVLGSADEVWAHAGDYDLVVVATANRAHVPQARRALELGLDVVVDKPLAGTPEEAQSLVDLAESRDRRLHVFQNRRWDSEVRTVRRVVAEGALGTVHRLESRFERWRPVPKGGWREDGGPEDLPGLLYDLGAHLVDQALLLLGPVSEVYARARSVRVAGAPDDDTQILLTHTSGAVSLLWASAVSAFTQPRMRVLGTGGGLQIDDLDGQEDQLRAGLRPGDDGWGVMPPEARVTLRTAANDGADVTTDVVPEPGRWQDYYAGVRASTRDGAPPPVDPRDVVADLRVIRAAVESAGTGSAVRLDPPAAHV